MRHGLPDWKEDRVRLQEEGISIFFSANPPRPYREVWSNTSLGADPRKPGKYLHGMSWYPFQVQPGSWEALFRLLLGLKPGYYPLSERAKWQ